MTICEVCEKDKPGKRGVCKDCKDEFPFVRSLSGQQPFDRKALWRAKNDKKVREKK